MGSEQQIILFGAGFFCGIVGGIGADGYRAWQSAVRIGRKANLISDCLCWCVLAAVVAALLFYLNGGEVRSYFFAALLGGYVCYRCLAGERVVRLWQWLMKLFFCVCRGVQMLLLAVSAPISAVWRKGIALRRWLRRTIFPKQKPPPEDKN